jgi:hypothetical protein
MALYRWPTDPKGKAAAHTISWDAHQAHLKANANPAKPGEVKISTPNGFIPVSEWDFGYGKGVLQPDPTAPLAPGAPPPAGELPLPVDSTYDSDIAGYDRTRRDTKTGLVGERDRGLKEYGFTEDPTSKALAFDPNNPFSRASLLKKNYDVSRASTGQNMGSRGQLYAGAYQTAQDSINRGQLGDEDTLQKSLGAFLAGNTGAMTDADTLYENNAATADARRTLRAPNDNPLYSPTAALPKPVIAPAVAPVVAAPKKPAKPAKRLTTLKAGPGVKATKNTTVKKTKNGRTVTYTTSTKGP